MTIGASPSDGSSSSSRLRPGHQRPGDREHLLLAAAQAAGRLVAPLRQPREVLEPAVDVGGDPSAVAPAVRAEAQVLRHRQPGERAAALGHVRDAAPAIPSRCASPARPGRRRRSARRRRTIPRDRPQRGRLAGAVRAEQRDHLALVDGERRPVQRPSPARTPAVRSSTSSRLTAGAPGRPRSRRGPRWTSAGGPSATFRPKSSTTTVSDIRITMPMWCSTSSTVRSSRRGATSISVGQLVDLLVGSPLAGSSSISSRGRWQPARGPARPASASRTAARRPGRPAIAARPSRSSTSSALRARPRAAPPLGREPQRRGHEARRRRRWCAPSITFSRTVSDVDQAEVLERAGDAEPGDPVRAAAPAGPAPANAIDPSAGV